MSRTQVPVPVTPPPPAAGAAPAPVATVRASRDDAGRAALLAIFLFAVYVLFYRGTFKNPADEWFMYTLADSISRNASLDVDQMALVGEAKGLAKFGPSGHLYSKYSLVESMAGVPLLWLSRFWPDLAQAPFALLVNPLLTAATAAVLFLTGRRLGYPTGPALASALTFGLATPAFVYTKTFTSEPAAALGLSLALFGLVAFRATGSVRPLYLGGAAVGAVVLSKQANLIVVPGFLLGLWLLRPPAWQDGRRARRLAAALLAFGIPLGLGLAGALLYDWLRFADPLQTGYGPADGGFTAPLVVSLLGLLVSPGRGAVIYAPVLLLSLLTFTAFLRRDRSLGLTLLAVGIPFGLLFAAWHGWHGGMVAWGPRHWLPLFPLACLPLLEWYRRLGRPRPGPAWAATGLILAVSALVQLEAVAFDYLPYVDALAAVQGIGLANEDEALARMTFEPARAPVLNQLRFLAPRYSDVFWLHGDDSGGLRFDGLAAAVAGAGLVVAAAAFVLGLRRVVPRFAPPAAAALVALCTLALVGRYTATAAPLQDDGSAAVRFVDRAAAPGAALVTVGTGPLGATFAWLKTDIDHFGLAFLPAERGLDDNTARSLERALRGRREVWTVWPDGEGGAVAAGLAALGPPASSWRFGRVLVSRYVFSGGP